MYMQYAVQVLVVFAFLLWASSQVHLFSLLKVSSCVLGVHVWQGFASVVSFVTSQNSESAFVGVYVCM
jgi:hypothetical protein